MPSKRADSRAGSSADIYPIRGTFFGCCASAVTPRASITTATRIGTAAFFIAHLISSVMYHADRAKEKCDLRAEGDRVSSSRKTRFSLRFDQQCIPLLRSDERPAHNCAANATPAAKSLIDLRRQRSLLLDGTLGLDLRIRDVAHRKPARGLVVHLTG